MVLSLTAWLISLSIMLPSSIHAVQMGISFLFQKLQIRLVLAPGKTADLLGHC